MTLLYLDTSALLRLYTQEPQYQMVVSAKAQSSGVVCHAITSVEAVAALTGRRRRKLLTGGAYQTALAAFEADWPTFRHVAADELLLHDAAHLTTLHPLRAYDAVHLAAAQAIAPLGLQFMTFDLNLRVIAQQVMPGMVWQP
ncbi:type II toxin-antitoxin system VapC family toxin [Deinococcus detaillensis]|uniref:Type II toxin-antitoxin system VapC family toxin n=1 Tax=Deinococcus detaillensis TaxID=2592048 RepID=A0A553UWX2_9DEIO|nr:type II toxin-antitoxin system VapC family toxin [Deinococcus detaillensis]TSA84697.1 type II toxin-antitoxin system VapC family toxin [Deinococcus detaillensis]